MKKVSETIAIVIVATILIGTFITMKNATAGEIGRDGRFIAYDNGTVLDTKTNLMWAAKDNGSVIKWEDAKSYCENYRGGGYTDWRMPTVEELMGLYDAAKGYDSNCPWSSGGIQGPVHLTELIHLTCGFVWASETQGSLVSCFCFISNKGYWIHPNPHYALPVRSAKRNQRQQHPVKKHQ